MISPAAEGDSAARAGQFARIQACVFDAYGTLFDTHSAVRRLAGRIGPDAERISAVWRQKQLEYTWLRSLMRSHVDFWHITSDALRYALDAFQVSDQTLADELLELYYRLEAYPDVKDTLAQLRRTGKQIAILSNGEPNMLAAAVESAGLGDLLDAIHSVEEVGVFKPDPRVYQLSVDKLRLPPGRICFVSTNPWDAAAAAHFGFTTVRLDRTGVPAEHLPGKIAAKIPNLGELPRLLGNKGLSPVGAH